MKNIVYSILATTTVLTVVVLFYVLINFNCSAIGPMAEEHLLKKNEIWIFEIIMLLLHLLLLTIAFLTYRLNKVVAWSIISTVFVSFLVVIKVSYRYEDKGPRKIDFNQIVWKKNSEKPIKMVRDIMWNFNLIGLSKQEVLNKFGEPIDKKKYDVTLNQDEVFYLTDVSSGKCFLKFTFSNEKVKAVELEEYVE